MTIVAEWLSLLFLGISLVLLVFVWRIVTVANQRLKAGLDEQFRQMRRDFSEDSQRLR